MPKSDTAKLTIKPEVFRQESQATHSEAKDGVALLKPDIFCFPPA
jgi:hypothetical protein